MHPAVRTPRSVSPLFLVLLLALFASVPAAAQQAGVRLSTVAGIQKTTRELMQLPNTISPLVSQARLTWELEQPDRSQLNQASGALELSTWPAPKVSGFDVQQVHAPLSPQVADLTFTGATLTDINAFPPDNQGAVGPSQYFVFVNGRLRTFDKTTGIADGVINADPDLFFSSVMTPVGGGVVINFTSDPQIRYDRLSGRWFLTIIDVPCANGSCTTLAPNRLLVAVSDAASNGIVSPATVWTFYYFQADVANFLDYPSLGIDSKALYIGGNMFTAAGSYVGTNGYVVRKTSALSGGPLVVTSFAGLALGAGDGPFAPRGVDNYDPAANEGYFIGVSNSLFGELVARRVSDPGGTPTVSANLLIPVSTTFFPIPVQHFGNTGGNNGRLDALDDRLFQAHIRNGRLWTSHNIAVSATGVASSASTRRDGVRWYELNGIRSTDNGGVRSWFSRGHCSIPPPPWLRHGSTSFRVSWSRDRATRHWDTALRARLIAPMGAPWGVWPGTWRGRCIAGVHFRVCHRLQSAQRSGWRRPVGGGGTTPTRRGSARRHDDVDDPGVLQRHQQLWLPHRTTPGTAAGHPDRHTGRDRRSGLDQRDAHRHVVRGLGLLRSGRRPSGGARIQPHLCRGHQHGRDRHAADRQQRHVHRSDHADARPQHHWRRSQPRGPEVRRAGHEPRRPGRRRSAGAARDRSTDGDTAVDVHGRPRRRRHRVTLAVRITACVLEPHGQNGPTSAATPGPRSTRSSGRRRT